MRLGLILSIIPSFFDCSAPLKKGDLFLLSQLTMKMTKALVQPRKNMENLASLWKKRIETKERFDLSLSLVIEVVEPREPDRETSQTKMNSYYIIL